MNVTSLCLRAIVVIAIRDATIRFRISSIRTIRAYVSCSAIALRLTTVSLRWWSVLRMKARWCASALSVLWR